MFFKLPKNKNIRKTIFNIVFVYLSTTILLVITISYLYIINQKEEIFSLHKNQSDLQASYIIEQLENIHDNITEEIAIYPRLDGVKSAIYDLDKNLIFSTFKENVTPSNKPYIITDKYIYFIKQIEPYYLGASYLVIQKETTHELKLKYQKVLFIVLLIILFLILTSILLAKLLIKPLSDNLTLLDRFIKDTTHELNTPVSAILNNLELLDLNNINEKNIKKINRIKIGAITISTIYDDLSFLLLNHKTKSYNEKLNISNILQERIEYFTILANNKNLIFDINIEQDVYIFIDKIKIERIFDNLISNSIKYSHKDSTIIIKLTKSNFSIEDFGIGIDKEKIKDIFIRYKRFDTSVGGFGIGYSIINKIIKEYNININIDSIKDKGTKVTLKW